METWRIMSICESTGFYGKPSGNRYERYTEGKTTVVVELSEQYNGNNCLQLAIVQTYPTRRSKPVFQVSNVAVRRLKSTDTFQLLDSLAELAKSVIFCPYCVEAMSVSYNKCKKLHWNCPKCNYCQQTSSVVAKKFLKIREITQNFGLTNRKQKFVNSPPRRR